MSFLNSRLSWLCKFVVGLTLFPTLTINVHAVAVPYSWPVWTRTPGVTNRYVGDITIGQQTVTVEYRSNDTTTLVENTDLYYCASCGGSPRDDVRSPYRSEWNSNIPPIIPAGGASLIQLTPIATHGFYFSHPVLDPIITVVSLNRGNHYVFDTPLEFELLAYGGGPMANTTVKRFYAPFGVGKLVQVKVTDAQGITRAALTSANVPTFQGDDASGVIGFKGFYTNITWHTTVREGWNGVNIGIRAIDPINNGTGTTTTTGTGTGTGTTTGTGTGTTTGTGTGTGTGATDTAGSSTAIGTATATGTAESAGSSTATGTVTTTAPGTGTAATATPTESPTPTPPGSTSTITPHPTLSPTPPAAVVCNSTSWYSSVTRQCHPYSLKPCNASIAGTREERIQQCGPKHDHFCVDMATMDWNHFHHRDTIDPFDAFQSCLPRAPVSDYCLGGSDVSCLDDNQRCLKRIPDHLLSTLQFEYRCGRAVAEGGACENSLECEIGECVRDPITGWSCHEDYEKYPSDRLPTTHVASSAVSLHPPFFLSPLHTFLCMFLTYLAISM